MGSYMIAVFLLTTIVQERLQPYRYRILMDADTCLSIFQVLILVTALVKMPIILRLPEAYERITTTGSSADYLLFFFIVIAYAVAVAYCAYILWVYFRFWWFDKTDDVLQETFQPNMILAAARLEGHNKVSEEIVQDMRERFRFAAYHEIRALRTACKFVPALNEETVRSALGRG